MSNSERSTSQEHEKSRAPESSLEPKKRTQSYEPEGFSKKRDAQDLRDENGSREAYQVFNEILNPELTEVINSTDTKGHPQPHTDELHHTDELYCTGELSHTDELRNTDKLYDTGELHAGTRKPNKNTSRSHERPKVTQKLVNESDS